jgi:agmatinase
MKLEFIKREITYQGCDTSFDDAEIVLVGAGYDGTSSYRSGSKEAPTAIRKDTFLSQEDYSPYFEKDITLQSIHDAGDIEILADKTITLKRIRQTTIHIFESGKKPCVIGGEHLVSLPVIEAAAKFYPDLHIIQLDAHLDLMDELFGNHLSHGTVMRRAIDIFKENRRIYQVGIRSGSKEEYEFANQHTCLYPFVVDEFIKYAAKLKDLPIYLTVDLDVFDPSLIPGTGTPEAGGIMFPDYISFLKAVKGLNIIGCDLVELSPPLDPSGTSTIVASKILRELLLIL